jgi:hypothetical protein
MPLTRLDVETATGMADDRFATHVAGNFDVDLLVGKVTIVNDQSNNQRWNYNIPLMYEMPNNEIDNLRQWWQGIHPNTGQILPPQLKHGHWIINIQWLTTNHRLFNMHVAVTAPTY